MDVTSLIIFLAIGGLAGWIAGKLIKGGSLNLVGNIVVGVIGAVIGGWVFKQLGISVNGLIGSIITAVVGATILLFGVSLIKK